MNENMAERLFEHRVIDAIRRYQHDAPPQFLPEILAPDALFRFSFPAFPSDTVLDIVFDDDLHRFADIFSFFPYSPIPD